MTNLILPVAVGEAFVDLLDGFGRVCFAGERKPDVGRKPGHEQRGRNAFAGDVADDHGVAAAGQRHVVVIIAADFPGRLVVIEEIIAGHLRRLRGHQCPLHPAGQLQVALHRPLGDDLLVHFGVVDRYRRLARDAGEHFQIGIGEAAPLVERIDLDDADRLAVVAHHRRAHHRANRKIGDALGHAEPLVAGGVGREDRFARLHGFFDNRAADPHPFFVAGATGFYGDRHERPIRPRTHHDEAAVGLRENLEQAIEDFRQDVFDGERLSQVVRDLDQRGQLYFRLGREAPAYGAVADVERGHHAGAGWVLGVVDQLGDARLFEVAHRIEHAGPEAACGSGTPDRK